MPEPIYSDTTELFYSRIPEVYRNIDPDYDWALKRWISGMLQTYFEVDNLIDRFIYVTPDDGGAPNDTSDLTDPQTADVAWLPWLAQLVGVRLDTSLPVQEQRDAIATALFTNKPGTKAAIAQAATKHLVGSKFVQVYDHTSDVSGTGLGGEWDMLITTLDSETLENDLAVSQATMASNTAWTPSVYSVNTVGASAWTTTGYTAGSGSTNPLRTNYTTFDGSGDSYVSGAVEPGATYRGRLAVRAGGVAVPDLAVKIQFYDSAGVFISESATTAIAPTSTWAHHQTPAMVAPGNAYTCRMRVTSTSGDYAVSNWAVVPTTTLVYVAPDDPGQMTVGNVVSRPPVNWARNASYDQSGGWSATNGNLAVTTQRFKYNNSCARLTATAADPYVTPGAVPLYEGERVRVSVWALNVEAGTGTVYRLRLIATSSTGTTSTLATVDVPMTDTDFVLVSATATAPANTKTVTAELVMVGGATDNQFYIDGWLITRGEGTYTYFDGNSAGCSYENPGDIPNSRSIGNPKGVSLLGTHPDIDGSAVLLNRCTDPASVIEWASLFSAYVTVTATDTYTAMLTMVASQAGSYVGVLEAIYYNGSDVETGRFRAAILVTTTPGQVSVTSVAPATSTRLRLKAYIFHGNKDEEFGIARAGVRLGTVTDWVAVTADPVQDVLDAGAKPAGVILYHSTASTEWSNIEANLPVWPDWEAIDWQTIEETGF